MSQAPVSVVIPSLNAIDLLPVCLESLLAQNHRSLEVLVVDNGSTDGSARLVAERFPSVKLLRGNHNLGYSAGCHWGASVARGRYLLFCDNDIQATPNAVSRLVQAMESDPSIGVAQGKMLLTSNPDRIESMGGFFTSTGILYQEERDTLDVHDTSGPQEVFGAKGAFMMIRRSLYQSLGGFDTDFVAQFEDTDLCWRSWLSGHRVVVVPESIVYHGRSTTTQRMPSEFVVYHASKNRICTLLKNLDARDMFVVLPIHVALTLAGMLFLLLTFRFSSALALAKAATWNIRNLSSTLAKRRDAMALKPDDIVHPLPHLRKGMPLKYLVSSARTVIGP